MEYTINPSKAPIETTIALPGSKNISLQALMIASLANGVSEIFGILIDNDTHNLIKALGQLGIVIQFDENTSTCIVAGCNGALPRKQAAIWCADSEMIACLLLAICATHPGVYYFDGTISLREKSRQGFLATLCKQDAQPIPLDASQLPFTLVGADTYKGVDLVLDNTFNDTMISALLIAAPLANRSFKLTLPDPGVFARLDLTCAMMADFGVPVTGDQQGELSVPAPHPFLPRKYLIEPDLSLGVYFFAALAVCGGEMQIPAFHASQAKQCEVKFLSTLEKMGCDVIETEIGTVLKSNAMLNGIDINLRHFSDCFVALAAIAPFAKSPMRISHIGHPSKTETKLLMSCKLLLEKMGIHVESGNHCLRIFPGMPKGIRINANENYRLGLMGAIIGLCLPGVTIENSQSIANIYPDFFHLWEKIAPLTPEQRQITKNA